MTKLLAGMQEMKTGTSTSDNIFMGMPETKMRRCDISYIYECGEYVNTYTCKLMHVCTTRVSMQH